MTADPPAVPISDDEITNAETLSFLTRWATRIRAEQSAREAAEARAARAEVKGFNEGIEAAAKWHDEQATIFDPVDAESASDHRVYATAIRALTRPAPATGHDTPPGESDV